MKFKVGDKVKNKKTGAIDFVKSAPGMKIYDMKGFLDSDKGFLLKGYGWGYQKSWKLVGRGRNEKVLPIKYVVFYEENDGDPMKTFSTNKELKGWLSEAKDDEDIDFSSIRVFEVKKELKVKTSFRLVG